MNTIKTITLRQEVFEQVKQYADENNLSFNKAVITLVQIGLSKEIMPPSPTLKQDVMDTCKKLGQLLKQVNWGE